MIIEYFRKIAGAALVILGIAGLILPGLQGILMITAGLALIGSRRMVRLLKKFTRRLFG
jgi:hypothetical protein